VTASRKRFAEVVRSEPVDLGLACLLVGAEVDRSLDVESALAALDALAAAARGSVPRTGVAAQAAALAGSLSGFVGGDFEDLRSSLLHRVLQTRTGLPLLLSVVWLEVAARLDVPAYAAALPGQVVVGIGDPEDEHVLVDTYAGGRLLTPADVAERGGVLGVLSAEDLLLRLLTNVRALTTRQAPSLEVARTRLWAVELSLLLPRHPLELRRERGELLVRLGAFVDGAEELEVFALVVEDADEAAAVAARREARMARAQLN
jgi:regulator of sirC expression with transglutaminase-like and TPR domain